MVTLVIRGVGDPHTRNSLHILQLKVLIPPKDLANDHPRHSHEHKKIVAQANIPISDPDHLWGGISKQGVAVLAHDTFRNETHSGYVFTPYSQ